MSYFIQQSKRFDGIEDVTRYELWADNGEAGTDLLYCFDTYAAADAAMVAANMQVGGQGIDFAGIAAQQQLVNDTIAALGGAMTWNGNASATVLGGPSSGGITSANPIASYRGTAVGDINSNSLATGVNLNLLPASASTVGANAIQHTAGIYTVVIDGTSTSVVLPNGNAVNALSFASMLASSPNANYTIETPILLLGCNAGADVSGGTNFAQQLANWLHAPVVAMSQSGWISNADIQITGFPGSSGPPGTITIAPVLTNTSGQLIPDPYGGMQPNMNQQGQFRLFNPTGGGGG